MDTGVEGISGRVFTEDGKYIDAKEATRRMRISKANKGKVPWNKGKKHSSEALARIKERTKQAMQNPMIRQKLSQLQYSRSASFSEDKRDQIRASLRSAWKVRRKRLLSQKACIIEWKEMIAESARRGGDDEDEFHWDSYQTLRKAMYKQRLQALKKFGGTKAVRSAEQRRKIGNAIKAKWADPEYRRNVLIGKQQLALTKHAVMKKVKGENYSKPRNVILNECSTARPLQHAKKPSSRNNLPPSYSDPQAEAKLEMIKQIRTNRAAKELKKREATMRARSLIAEAEKAAKQLEATAVSDASVQALLSDIRKLLKRATYSVETTESGQSACPSMLERVSNGSAYTDTFQLNCFVDNSEGTVHGIPDSGDSGSENQPFFTKSREILEKTSFPSTWEISSSKEISRSLDHSYEHSHPISSPNFGSLKIPRSTNCSEGSGHERINDEVIENGKVSEKMNSAGKNITLIDNQKNKLEPRPAKNVKKEIIPSIADSMNLSLPGSEYSIHDIAGKFEAMPLQMVKDGVFTTEKREKKWMCGRLIEVTED